MNYHRQTVEVLINKDSDTYRRLVARAEKDGVSVEDVINMALLLRADVAIARKLDELDAVDFRNASEPEVLQMYTEYRDGKPHAYRYGPPWVSMQLYVEGGYPTPEEAMEAWRKEHELSDV